MGGLLTECKMCYITLLCYAINYYYLSHILRTMQYNAYLTQLNMDI